MGVPRDAFVLRLPALASAKSVARWSCGQRLTRAGGGFNDVSGSACCPFSFGERAARILGWPRSVAGVRCSRLDGSFRFRWRWSVPQNEGFSEQNWCVFVPIRRWSSVGFQALSRAREPVSPASRFIGEGVCRHR